MDDLMDKINIWGSDDNDYESEVNEDATTEATVLTTKISTTPDPDSSGDECGGGFMDGIFDRFPSWGSEDDVTAKDTTTKR